MERRLEFAADGGTAGRTVKDILKGYGLTERQISRLKFKEGGITVDGQPVTVRHVLREGERLSLRLQTDGPVKDVREDNPSLLPAENETLWAAPAEGLPPFVIIYEDEDILVADKPHGLAVHPSHGHYNDTLCNQAAAYLGVARCADLHVIGRLDKDTGGLVLFAKNAAAASILSRQRKEGKLEKRYLALAEGRPEGDYTDPAQCRTGNDCPEVKQCGAAADDFSGTAGASCGVISLPLAKESEAVNRMIVSPEGKEAVTHYRVLRYREGQSLLELKLEQGRTHQIRAHLSAIGCPVVGDVIYGEKREADMAGIAGCADGESGSEDLGASGQVLHLQAHSLRLFRPFTGEELFLEADRPEWA